MYSGGVMLRIQGSNLDSVSVANLIIKRVYDGGEDKYQSVSSSPMQL